MRRLWLKLANTRGLNAAKRSCRVRSLPIWHRWRTNLYDGDSRVRRLGWPRSVLSVAWSKPRNCIDASDQLACLKISGVMFDSRCGRSASLPASRS